MNDDEEAKASVVRCALVSRDRWSVSVDNAVGVIAISDLQITVQPKIPLEHLVFLLEKAKLVPRLDRSPIQVSEGTTLLELIARWFLFALDRLFRDDLLQDYREHVDVLSTMRGRLDVAGTMNLYYSGNPKFRCAFEEYDVDSPLNRLLRGGAESVASNTAFPADLRRRLRIAARRFVGVGPLQHGDAETATDRRTAEYADAAMLARCILGCESRSVEVGGKKAWAFLLPTPYAVQHALTALLASYLSDCTTVKAMAIPIREGLQANPDLVFEAFGAVGDVKYKRLEGAWKRADLYQIVAFAALLRYRSAAILTFRVSDDDIPAQVVFGNIRVSAIAWRAERTISADDAALRFCEDVKVWLFDAVKGADLSTTWVEHLAGSAVPMS
jgi:5-methylcytosine-specific restriction enzyme subunit McrC